MKIFVALLLIGAASCMPTPGIGGSGSGSLESEFEGGINTAENEGAGFEKSLEGGAESAFGGGAGGLGGAEGGIKKGADELSGLEGGFGGGSGGSGGLGGLSGGLGGLGGLGGGPKGNADSAGFGGNANAGAGQGPVGDYNGIADNAESMEAAGIRAGHGHGDNSIVPGGKTVNKTADNLEVIGNDALKDANAGIHDVSRLDAPAFAADTGITTREAGQGLAREGGIAANLLSGRTNI